VVDPWEEQIARWLDGGQAAGPPRKRRDDGAVTTGEILWGALGIPPDRQTNTARVPAILQKLGWLKGKKRRIDGAPVSPYFPPGTPEHTLANRSGPVPGSEGGRNGPGTGKSSAIQATSSEAIQRSRGSHLHTGAEGTSGGPCNGIPPESPSGERSMETAGTGGTLERGAVVDYDIEREAIETEATASAETR